MNSTTFSRRLVLSAALVGFACGAQGQNVGISISSIQANSSITGQVTGLSGQALSDYKVLVYVRTDKWYIHPFAGQDEGRSWAAIQSDGKWRIATVQREFKASAVAAVLVRRNYPEPNTAETLDRLQNSAIAIKELRNTPDYGKL